MEVGWCEGGSGGVEVGWCEGGSGGVEVGWCEGGSGDLLGVQHWKRQTNNINKHKHC